MVTHWRLVAVSSKLMFWTSNEVINQLLLTHEINLKVISYINKQFRDSIRGYINRLQLYWIHCNFAKYSEGLIIDLILGRNKQEFFLRHMESSKNSAPFSRLNFQQRGIWKEKT
jgi:hypothetical protein